MAGKAKLILSLFGGALAGASATTLFHALANAIFSSHAAQEPLIIIGAEHLVSGILFIAPTIFTIHVLARTLGKSSLRGYALCGCAFGLMIVLAYLAIIYSVDGSAGEALLAKVIAAIRVSPAIPISIAAHGLNGTLAGVFFWLFRRPDRDGPITRQTQSEAFQ